MNCEHVEERLSAYLDNVLTPDERREIAIHLQTCPMCMVSLAELHQNDILLAQLPRVSPRMALYERIFSSPEFLELTGTTGSQFWLADEWTRPLKPRRSAGERPLLIALPGGCSPQFQPIRVERTLSPIKLLPSATTETARRQKRVPRSLLYIALAIFMIVALITLGLLRLSVVNVSKK